MSSGRQTPIVERFERDLDGLLPSGEKLGLAVSGGPDSLALLLLTEIARPGQFEVATVDHGLRAGSASEARRVASLCAARGVAHVTLHPGWTEPPSSGVQEKARAARYVALGHWAKQRGLGAIATAHHRDDQAETLLMRLVRGAGVRGLAGIRPSSLLPELSETALIRPLLSWSKDELRRICFDAGVEPICDPSNEDANFERVRVRKALAEGSLLRPEALARSAAWLAQADKALDWAADIEWLQVTERDSGISYCPNAPEEIRRRVVLRILRAVGQAQTDGPRGREVDRLMATLESGGIATLQGVRCSGGATWNFTPAPARSPARRGPR